MNGPSEQESGTLQPLLALLLFTFTPPPKLGLPKPVESPRWKVPSLLKLKLAPRQTK